MARSENGREDFFRAIMGLGDVIGHLAGAEANDLEKKIAESDLKEPEMVFAEACIAGQREQVNHLARAIESFHKRASNLTKRLEEAEQTEKGLLENMANLSEKLLKAAEDASRARHLAERRLADLKAQDEANKVARAERADLRQKFAQIEKCLGETFSKAPTLEDADTSKVADKMMAVVEKIAAIVTDPTTEKAETHNNPGT